jgi:hypothetical protein
MEFLTIQTIIAFGLGCVAATVIWYFVIRNNRQHLDSWMAYPEQTWNKIAPELEELSDDVKQKIEDIIKKGK